MTTRVTAHIDLAALCHSLELTEIALYSPRQVYPCGRRIADVNLRHCPFDRDLLAVEALESLRWPRRPVPIPRDRRGSTQGACGQGEISWRGCNV